MKPSDTSKQNQWSVYAVWRWPWKLQILLIPLAVGMYALSACPMFYVLHRSGIYDGPLYTACGIAYWPLDWLYYHTDIIRAIGDWQKALLHWLFGPER